MTKFQIWESSGINYAWRKTGKHAIEVTLFAHKKYFNCFFYTCSKGKIMLSMPLV